MLSPLAPSLSSAGIPLEKLAVNTQLSQQEKVVEASRQFEAILLRQIFAAAHKPLFGGAAASGSSGIYQDMIVDQLADSVSRSGALGFGNSLSCQLNRELCDPEPAQGGGAVHQQNPFFHD